MATFVLVHGATAGGWYWNQVAPRLREGGHAVFTPTLTGLGERSHLASPEVGLDTHVRDIANVLEYEDLRDVILVGKSYAGMVTTGVASATPDRLAHLVYLEAVVPQHGQSFADVLASVLGRERVDATLAQMRSAGDGWRVPLQNPTDPRLTPHPLKTYLDPVVADDPRAAALPRTYIYCTQKEPGLAAAFTAHGAQVARQAGWRYHELPTAHEPEQTAPEALTALLLECATDRA